jgi:phosphate transport system substrate-binding protein
MKKIMMMLAVSGMAVSGMAADANRIVVDGSTTVGPIAKAFAEYYMGKNKDVNITVSESGSGNGAKSLVNAACDVATMSRPMKSSEKKSAQEAGVMPVEYIIAMDGIAMVVHPSNPVENLTVEQIKGIYSGKITNWKELGGPDKAIVIISRDTNSGTYEAFKSLVTGEERMSEKVEYVGSNGAIRQRIMSTENAVGFVGLAFLEGVKSLKVNGVEVSPETILEKKYPISRPLYLYTIGRPKDGTHLFNFVNLYRTPDGRKIVDDTGFVSLKE